MNENQRVWLLGLLLVAAIVLAYQKAWNAGFIWDDDLYVTENKLLTASDGLQRIWFSLDSPSQYFPLTYTTFRLERTLWGLNAAGYHWINILLHSANALLLWRLLRRLSLPGAWLAAAIFALHPVQVESVAWITERKNVLTLFFCLLTMLAWERFTENGLKPLWRFYALALVLFMLALFSKSTACTLPAALFLVLWLKGKPIGWRRLAQILPFLVLGIGMGLLTIWWERHQQGATGKFFVLGAMDRILIASRAVWFYAGKLLWPANLCFSYPHWTINASNSLAYGWLIAGIGLVMANFFARKHIGRGVEVALIFYVATLSPLLGFFVLSTFRYSFVADHYQYVASIGPLALAAASMARGLGYFGKWKSFLRAVLSVALLIALGILTWRQTGMYADLETLWRTTIKKNPDSFMAHNNLANLLFDKGQLDEAMIHYQRSLEIQPDAEAAAYNLANVFFAKGQMDEAIAYYRKALEIHPEGASIAYKLGNALLNKGQLDEAIIYYRRALQLQPDAIATLSSLGNALLEKGQVNEAIVYFQKAVTISPDSAKTHSNLGNAFVRKGRLGEAIVQYEAALRITPNDVPTLSNLSWLLAACPDPSIRNGPKAVELAQMADRISGGKSLSVLRTLSAAYAEVGQFAEAIAAAEKALKMPVVQANTAHADALRSQIKMFDAHSPIRDLSLTNADENFSHQ